MEGQILDSPAESRCRIRVLSNLMVNKIAAGEVIERPASVVKELMENSLDAGAKRIAVAVEDGGRALLRVVDDGCGMTEEELRLSVIPHATSKISEEDDLSSIRTMGFRGEALASIAAVSRLRLVSRVPGSDEGFEVRMTGDQMDCEREAGSPIGTTVEVRDLFFNVPVRRKFLRTPSTEVGHITEHFARIALAHPAIGFEMTSNGRAVHSFPMGDHRLGRIAKFYGEELAESLLHVRREERGVILDAYAAPPRHSRASAQWQYAYVNGRFVRDRFIQHAIKEAYRGLMEPNRHGVVFVFITVDPHEVDVNVHPTKIEVRWAESNLVHSQVLSALREAFQRADLSPAFRSREAPPAPDDATQERMRQELAAVLKAASPYRSDPPRETTGDDESWRSGAMAAGQNSLEGVRFSFRGPTERAHELYRPPEIEAKGSLAAPLGSIPFQPQGFRPPRAVQMHNLYLVAETDDGIVIVDQHALHERVMYEQLKARIAEGPLESQRLLLPETLKVTPAQMNAIEAHAELLQKLGLDVSLFGADAVAVHASPAILKDTDVPSFLSDLLDKLAQSAAGSSTEIVFHEVLDMMACKAAVKAGDPLSDEEVQALMHQRHLIEKASSCPHGRPTMLRLSKNDLNRQFKRT